MRRRELIKLLGGAAAAYPLAATTWPRAARAQRTAMPVIGFLDPRSSPDSFSNQIAGFHRGLKDVGFVENERLNTSKIDESLIHQVEQPTRCSD